MLVAVNDAVGYMEEDFAEHQDFSLIAEDDSDRELLRRMVLLREHTSLRALHFSFENPPRRPMEREYTAVDVALVEDSIFTPREVDNQAAAKSVSR
jgi:hypothetical protein